MRALGLLVARTSPPVILGLLAVAVLTLALSHSQIGARGAGMGVAWAALTTFDPQNFDHLIFLRLHLPHLLGACLSGLCLAVAGTVMQALLRNPLAEPHIVGLNAGASLAVVATLTIPFPPFDALSGIIWRPLVAAAGGGLLFALVLLIASAGRTGLTLGKVTFCGIALSALATTLTSALLLLDEETLSSFRLWLIGDLAPVSLQTLAAAAPMAAVGLIGTALLCRRLSLLALGDDLAQGLGVPVKQTRLLGLLCTALLCGAAVSVVGSLGFIGLIVPALCRRFGSASLGFHIPAAGLVGAGLMIAADMVGRSIMAPQDIPVGLITAVIGAPLFIGLVRGILR